MGLCPPPQIIKKRSLLIQRSDCSLKVWYLVAYVMTFGKHHSSQFCTLLTFGLIRILCLAHLMMYLHYCGSFQVINTYQDKEICMSATCVSKCRWGASGYWGCTKNTSLLISPSSYSHPKFHASSCCRSNLDEWIHTQPSKIAHLGSVTLFSI